jgi:putative glutathione S-transferase
MGLLVEGKWADRWYDTKESGGRFQRPETQFRGRVTADGSSGFPAEAGRYHLYVADACPWAHRTVIFRKLKRLEQAISLSFVEPLMLEHGWTFAPGSDPLYGSRFLHEVYTRARADYTGRVTVPALWDKRRETVVCNESAEIIRMLNSEFDALGDASLDFYPPTLRSEIDELNATVYDRVNNGVYKAGFATSQEAYDEAFDALFEALDRLDARLGAQRWLAGDQATEADWRLFTTLVRFDAVYFGHFKCNERRIVDYPNLSGYLRELYQWPGVAETVDFAKIKQHYYGSHRNVNPTGIVPKGPQLDLTAPHGRESLR